ncbi:MAG: hypothetical protein PHC61_03975 [Chitinivibrionales bacterium]|nr:hypothetical protein [Chitinivibrionales bacterium]
MIKTKNTRTLIIMSCQNLWLSFLIFLLLAIACSSSKELASKMKVSLFILSDSADVQNVLTLADSCIDDASNLAKPFATNFVAAEEIPTESGQIKGEIACKEDKLKNVDMLLGGLCFQSKLKIANLGKLHCLWGHRSIVYLSVPVRPFYMVDSARSIDAISPVSLKIKKAGNERDVLYIGITKEDSKRFEILTANNVSRYLAICINGEVYGTPRIRNRISSSTIALPINKKDLTELEHISKIL